MKILGIESSCDDTAAAVVEDGIKILSSVVSSQVKIHHPFGGVVPELASRQHIKAIIPVVNQALLQAGTSLSEIDGIAATQGPGLIGSLLVGFSFAKAFAFALGLPMVGVNHLLGHIHTALLSDNPPDFPFVALLVSGGHTGIYHITSPLEFKLLGQTRDDAAGEAFDKVAKMLGLGYPGGKIISNLSRKGDPDKIKFPRPYLDKNKFDFSFSGIKTAVNRYISTLKETAQEKNAADIAAGFQEAVVEVLSYKLIRAASHTGCQSIAVVGGVAANARLREKVIKDAAAKGLLLHIPDFSLCGDNAAMIAAAGYHQLRFGAKSGLEDDVFSRVATF